MGSTWDPRPGAHARPALIGDEARDTAPGNTENLDFYAPTVNLSRDPRWGRNDESWSEDPTLTAALAGQYVDGLQGQTMKGTLPASANGYYKAIATLKHYAANNSEVNRRSGSSDMDQRTLREYYTAQFADIIEQAHPGSIMSSYNEVNGVPAAASVQLMDEARPRDVWLPRATSPPTATRSTRSRPATTGSRRTRPRRWTSTGDPRMRSPPVRTSTATPATTTSTATGTPSRPRSSQHITDADRHVQRRRRGHLFGAAVHGAHRDRRVRRREPGAVGAGGSRSDSAARPGSATRPTTRSPRPRSGWRRRARARTRAWCC